jgi:hypothetical protein
MSVIAFKATEDKIQVAFDGRCVSNGDCIETEEYKKCYKISDSLIVGATGLADTVEIFIDFVKVNKLVFEKMNSKLDAIPMMLRFKQALIDRYGFTDEDIKELGGFLIVNKNYHAVFYYDENTFRPYPTREEYTMGAFGSTGIYTSALIDCGIPIDEAIKMSAKKYTSINDNVTVLEISR